MVLLLFRKRVDVRVIAVLLCFRNIVVTEINFISLQYVYSSIVNKKPGYQSLAKFG